MFNILRTTNLRIFKINENSIQSLSLSLVCTHHYVEFKRNKFPQYFIKQVDKLSHVHYTFKIKYSINQLDVEIIIIEGKKASETQGTLGIPMDRKVSSYITFFGLDFGFKLTMRY